MPSELRAIIGLGNPGRDYADTRHNAGFWFADAFARAHGGSFRTESKFRGELARVKAAGADVLLLKPSTYMNLSGEAAQLLAQFYKLAPGDMLVAHDELDLPVGTVRLKKAGGHGGHNGLRSLTQHLGADYLRLRIGVGHPGRKEMVMPYLTEMRITRSDETLVMDGIARALPAVETWLAGDWNKAMQQLHSES
ncbi:MAG TPA: aminoacyl-tRNA hydrolase [Nevskiaceae bacterium]|nr:aminoacyl-tRNA hydrolase [Nevskiaceae bacterium]